MYEATRNALLKEVGGGFSTSDSLHPVDSVMVLVMESTKDTKHIQRGTQHTHKLLTSPSILGGRILDRWIVLYSPEFNFTTTASAFTICITWRVRDRQGDREG